MTYLDKYPDCIGCPVSRYCGTVVGSIKLCHSCDDEENQHVLTLSKAAPSMSEEDYIEGKLSMWDNITD